MHFFLVFQRLRARVSYMIYYMQRLILISDCRFFRLLLIYRGYLGKPYGERTSVYKSSKLALRGLLDNEGQHRLIQDPVINL